jgi:plastocyanin
MSASFEYGGEAPAVPTVSISILKDSATQGNPDYDPDTTQVTKGDMIVWTNNDSTMHTVTSNDGGATFDSSIINAGETFKLDTSTLELGKHDYICIVHPWMSASFDLTDSSGARLAEGATATDPNSIPPEEIPVEEAPIEAPVETPEVTVEAPETVPEEIPVEEAPIVEPAVETSAPAELVTVDMAAGTASNTNCGNECFIPNIAHVTVGGTVTWKNADTAAHTATEMESKFDSSLLAAGAEYSHTFSEAGTFEYMCIVHPWMKGTVIVG